MWDPHQTCLRSKLESIQRRAVRYTCHNYNQTASVTNMQNTLKWLSLEDRREMHKLIMMYKIVNSMVALDISNFAKHAHRATRANKDSNFIQISTSTSYHQASYFPSTITKWNSLSENTKRSKTIDQFKQQLYQTYQPN